MNPSLSVRYHRWKYGNRNTGMTLSWSFTDKLAEPEYRYIEYNKHFIEMANIIHEEGGVTQRMMELVKKIRKDDQTKYESDEEQRSRSIFTSKLFLSVIRNRGIIEYKRNSPKPKYKGRLQI